MVAPTRELVAELNRRAREHRLDHSTASWEVLLADGNQASVGDVIITRSNDRRLRLTATDWVKNGDRWTITRMATGGPSPVVSGAVTLRSGTTASRCEGRQARGRTHRT
jgi:hypothetical protein